LFLQEVNYYYDKTGRLIRINDPGQMECYQDEEYCRLYVEFCVLTEIREVDCNPLTSLDIGGQSYPVSPPLDLMDLNSSPILQSLIAEALDYYGYTGSVTVVSYKQGMATCYEITITNSNAPVIQFKSNAAVCAQTVQQECCSREVPDNGGGGTSGQANNFDLFYEKIDYDGLDISRIEYTSDCRTGKMRNDYTYDKNHRVTLQDNTIFNPERQDDWYTASFTYDAAGNILTLKRNGMFGPQPGQQTYVPIDDLLYEYDLNTPGVKQLKSIDDLLQGDPQPLGFKPDILYYGYDGNGNMLSSQHGTVTWNVINMPLTAAIPGGEVKFDYTFSAEKTRMQISGSEAEDRLYLGGAEFVFDQNAGIYIADNYQHEEGRKQYRNDDYEQDPKPHAMQYQITDHLGNLAVLFSDANDDGHITSEKETSDPDEIEVLQRHFYYPFGMDMDGTWLRVKPYEDRYRYNHKELTKGLGWYAYGARYYDAAVGRFTGVDPLAVDFAAWSTYSYTFNNPIRFIDPDGRAAEDIIVTTSSGKELFRLDDGKTVITRMTARKVYARGIQWFESTADNYMPLISKAEGLPTFSELKHFSWNEVAEFAETDRWMLSYRPGGSGDWKADGKPGEGYLMVTVDGEPYWTDAIGQIPFAVDKFTDELEDTGSADVARERTIEAGNKFGDGNVFGGESDYSNSYDNAMIKRAINWAEKRYKVIKSSGWFGNNYDLQRTKHSPSNLSKQSDEKQ
jgi:RHS repeat-associated protein